MLKLNAIAQIILGVALIAIGSNSFAQIFGGFCLGLGIGILLEELTK